jgi:hypothetical protein
VDITTKDKNGDDVLIHLSKKMDEIDFRPSAQVSQKQLTDFLNLIKEFQNKEAEIKGQVEQEKKRSLQNAFHADIQRQLMATNNPLKFKKLP